MFLLTLGRSQPTPVQAHDDCPLFRLHPSPLIGETNTLESEKVLARRERSRGVAAKKKS